MICFHAQFILFLLCSGRYFCFYFSEIKVENQNSLLSQAECNTPLARFSSIILREEVGIFTHFGFFK